MTTSPIGLDSTRITYQQDPEFFRKLQGNILRPHGKPCVAHLLLTFDPAKVPGVKTLIRNMLSAGLVTSAALQAEDHATYGGLYLSDSGYGKLGLSATAEPFDDNAFRQGMKVRGPLVYGDPDPAKWDPVFQPALDALVLFAAGDGASLDALVRQFGVLVLSGGNAVTYSTQTSAELLNSEGQVIENFGFRDGISQPLVFLDDIEAAGPTTFWDPSATVGQFVIPDPGADGTFGSYVVYRKLEQDVAKFQSQLHAVATELGIDVALAGAYAMGRFQDGTPVAVQKTPSGASMPLNDFDYAADLTGSKCPFHSHARKTNPRGDTTKIPNSGTIPDPQERAHRISRRQTGYADPDSKVGLQWMCFGAGIVPQFEFIQSAWSNTNNFVEQQVGLDAVIGQGTQVPADGQNVPVAWGTPTFRRFNVNNCVYMRGGELFFAPSMPTLDSIAGPG